MKQERFRKLGPWLLAGALAISLAACNPATPQASETPSLAATSTVMAPENTSVVAGTEIGHG